MRATHITNNNYLFTENKRRMSIVLCCEAESCFSGSPQIHFSGTRLKWQNVALLPGPVFYGHQNELRVFSNLFFAFCARICERCKLPIHSFNGSAYVACQSIWKHSNRVSFFLQTCSAEQKMSKLKAPSKIGKPAGLPRPSGVAATPGSSRGQSEY